LKIAVLGVGLIGGSIGLAARRRTGAHVCGFDPDPAALATALELGAIDEQAPDLASSLRGADMVFVAAPVSAVSELVRATLMLVGEDCVVSDVGSTKGAIVRAIADPRFVGGHPLAGSELAGVEHAHEDLFDGAIWHLCPPADASARSERSCERIRGLLMQLGASPVAIDADVHDRLMATVSHLPHVLANLLVAQLAHLRDDDTQPVSPQLLGVGPSFRDATRVAGTNSAVWTDIYLSNHAALIAAIDELTASLGRIRGMLEAGDAAGIHAWNERARAERRTLLRTDS
jgi:prephenate dehydrogenase